MIGKKIKLSDQEYLLYDDSVPVQHVDLVPECRFFGGAFRLAFASSIKDTSDETPQARIAGRYSLTPEGALVLHAMLGGLLAKLAVQPTPESRKAN